jgi:hypothetical protein
MEFIKEDKQFLTALGWALLALLLSAIILFVLSFVYVAANAPGGAANTYSKTVPGKQLRSRMGTAQAAGDGVEITGFKTHENQQHC